MRLMKMLGLAAVAALATMAFAASSASADSLCTVDIVPTGACPAGNVYVGPVVGLSASAVLTSGSFSSLCKSEVLATYLKNDGPHTKLLLLITMLNFTECTGSCKSALPENLPYNLEAIALTSTANITADEKGNLALLLECTIAGFPVNCLYESAKAVFKYELTAAGGVLNAAAIPLVRGGDSGLCASSVTWNAKYAIFKDIKLLGATAHASPLAEEGGPLWLTALP